VLSYFRLQSNIFFKFLNQTLEWYARLGRFLVKTSLLAFIFGVKGSKDLIIGRALDGYRMAEPWANDRRKNDVVVSVNK
jgi:hypothetical protein